MVIVPATGLTITQNIGDTVDWVTDLTVGIWNWSSPPVVGNNYVKKVVEFNRGTIAVSSNNQYDYDAQAPFVSSTIAPTSYIPNINRVAWYNALSLPLRKREYQVTHYIPPTTPINTALLYTDTIFPVTGDTTWWDNSLMRIDYTVGPYDPNYKEVTPRGSGAQGFISPADSILEYVIHFQNLGNYYAQNVLITDQLSNYLEPSTLRVIYATDPVNTRISPTGVIEFIFDNIYLPPLQDDSLNSNGFVVYTVHLKPNLPDGTEITNSANIYFDYNPPIETNTTINTISITGINDIISENNIIVYPNPNSGNFLVYLKESFTGEIKFTLYSISGQQIFDRIEEVVGKRDFVFGQDDISPGVYILNIQTSESVIRKKIVINR